MDEKPNTIDTTDPRQRWQWHCPDCDSTNWRVHNGTFGCRACKKTVKGLVNAKTGTFRHRDWFAFIGPHAEEKAEESKPPGVGPYR